jgi:osmotically-inducible protein OsmY
VQIGPALATSPAEREVESDMKKVIHAAAISALLAGAPLSYACNRGPDVKEQVEHSLEQANLDDVNVDWDKNENVVHLKGSVDTAADRQRAEEVATAAVGTSGKVLNELTVEGMNDTTADNLDGEIRDRLSEMVDRDPTLKERDIDFDVNNGVVAVKGEVRSAAEKNRVGEIVKSAPGVKDFSNGLEIKAAGR